MSSSKRLATAAAEEPVSASAESFNNDSSDNLQQEQQSEPHHDGSLQLQQQQRTRKISMVPLRRVSEVEIGEPQSELESTEDVDNAQSSSQRPEETAAAFARQDGLNQQQQRRFSDIKIVEPEQLNNDEQVLPESPPPFYDGVRRVSEVEIEEPPVEVEMFPVELDVATEDVVVPLSNAENDGDYLPSSFRPSRGTFQIPGVENLSTVRIEEPANEPATASTAHDMSEGTERSDEDYLISPTSVATKKISNALLRDVSLVKVQEPDVNAVTDDEPLPMTTTLLDAPSITLSLQKDSAVLSTKLSKSSVSGSATKFPGAVAVAPPSSPLSDTTSSYRQSVGAHYHHLQDEISRKTGEHHRPPIIPGSIRAVSPRERKRLIEQWRRRDDDDNDGYSSGLVQAGIARNQTSEHLPGASLVLPRRQQKNVSSERRQHDDESSLHDDIAIKTGEHHRTAALPGAIPVSSRERRNLKDDSQQHDDSLLQDAIAIKSGEHHRIQATSSDFRRAMSGPGAVPISPPQTRRTMSEDLHHRGADLLHEATAAKSGSHHRRNRRRQASTMSTQFAGAVPVAQNDVSDNTHNDSTHRRDSSLLREDIAVKTGEHHHGRRSGRRRLARRSTVDHVGANRSEPIEPTHSRHVLKLSKLGRRRRKHQAEQDVAAGNEAASNAKMEEYDDLVRIKGEMEEEWREPDDLERPEMDDISYEEYDQYPPGYPIRYPAMANFEGEADDSTSHDNELQQDNAGQFQSVAVTAYVQPVSEWEAEKAAELRKKRRRRYIIIAVVLVVIGVVIGVVIAVTDKGGNAAPVQSPTSAPTIDISPCVDDASGVFASQRYAALRALVLNNSLGEPTRVDVANSPQRKALCWLAEGDGMQLAAESSNLPAILQRYTLAVLYYGLLNVEAGTGWATTNFLSPDNECNWEGIICNITNTVTTIQIFYQNLIGTMPAEIVNLRNAEMIDFNNNGIVALPSDIWTMTWLSLMDFGFNQITMSIPSEVGRMKNLTKLSLESNGSINGTLPAELFTLSNLAYISLHSNQISGSLSTTLGNTSNTALRYLYLASNHISGSIPSGIGWLTNLENLDLSSNLLKGTIPSSLGKLVRAKTIDLDANKLQGSMPDEVCRLRQGGTLQFLRASKSVNCSCCTKPGSL